MTFSSIETVKRYLGWCPNHPVQMTPPAKDRMVLPLVLIVCLLCVSVSALLFAADTSHGDAYWIFSRDTSGTLHFEKRVVVPGAISGVFSGGAAQASTIGLPGGKYSIIVQHPNPDGTFDVVPSGDWILDPLVTPPGLTDGMKLFKMNGPGSLQGKDAYEALVVAIKNPPTSDDVDG
jgi:hypothetical protein